MTSHARALLCVLGLGFASTAAAQARAARISATAGAQLDEWSARLEQMLDGGELALRAAREDTLLVGRVHERFTQLYKGVPVFGGELVRQGDGRRTLTVFGTLYEGIALDVAAALQPAHARRAVEARGARLFGDDAGPELMVLPLDTGEYRLTYRVRAALLTFERPDLRQFFVDAGTGDIAFEYSDLQAQAVGTGIGVLNDQKKLSVRQSGGSFVTDDRLRPPVIKTYDLKGNVDKFLAWYFGAAVINDADLASDADNHWTDGADVDAHAYMGYTYDYYFRRMGRRGLDNGNISVFAFTHPIRREEIQRYANAALPLELYCNAFYITGSRVLLFGEGLPPGRTCGGKTPNYYSGALDIVAHEYTHGVTDFSSRLIYRNESGALNEAFSDIMGTAVEFFFQEPGDGPLRADYLEGEDITPGGSRSLQNPAALGHPDHYSIRYLGSLDNGGVHTNSSIANHAFYLAIEGGAHRLSGVVVQGVGGASREQIERVFYRAFTSFLTPASDFAAARLATIQATRELYGADGAVERAITQAWTAVGVN